MSRTYKRDDDWSHDIRRSVRRRSARRFLALMDDDNCRSVLTVAFHGRG